MKNSRLLAALFCLCIHNATYAGPYVRAFAGLGVTDAAIMDGFGNKNKTRAAFAYEGGATFGDRFGKISPEIGVGYLRSGYATPKTIGGVNGRYYINQVAVPLRMGYVAKEGKTSVMPVLGVDVTYNYSSRQPVATYRDPYSPLPPIVEATVIEGSQFRTIYRPVSAFASAELRMEYRLYPNVAFTYGPRVAASVTNVKNTTVSLPGYSISSQRNIVAFFDCGLKWDLTRRQTQR